MLLVALLAFRVTALKAILLSLLLLLALGFWFPMSADGLATMAQQVTGVTLNIVFIMLGGMLLSTQSTLSGAQRTMSDWFSEAVGSPHRAVLLFGLGVTPLMESIIGWGVGVIVSIPLLVRTGLTATKAAAVGLLGLVLCPWGSLAPGMLLTALLADEPLTDIGIWTAIFTLPVLCVFGGAIAWIGIGRALTPRLIVELVATIGVMWVTLWATNTWVTPVLAGAFSGFAGVATLLACGRLAGAKAPRFTTQVTRAFAPYGLLVGALIVAIALTSLLQVGAATEFWTSPGLWLMLTAAVAPAIFGMPRADALVAARRAASAWFPVCTTTLLYVSFGILLTVSGMAGALADTAAALGGGFILILPIVGLLAGYVTSSNSAAGAMLTQAVSSSASAIGASPASALGLLTAAVGAAVPTAPSRVLLAVSVADGAREAAATTGMPATPPARLGAVTAYVLGANGVLLLVLIPLGWVLLR